MPILKSQYESIESKLLECHSLDLPVVFICMEQDGDRQRLEFYAASHSAFEAQGMVSF